MGSQVRPMVMVLVVLGLALSEGRHGRVRAGAGWRLQPVGSPTSIARPPDSSLPNRHVPSRPEEKIGMETQGAFPPGMIPFRLYTEKEGLPQSNVNALVFDKNNYLWVATQDGAAYYNGKSWKNVPMPSRTVSNWVRTICAASDGSLWFGRRDGGVCHLKNGEWEIFTKLQGLPHNGIMRLAETRNRQEEPRIWAGTERGLACWEKSQWRAVNLEPADSTQAISSLEVFHGTDGDQLVVGTNQGVLLETGEGWRLKALPPGFATIRILALAVSHDPQHPALPQIWIGTENGIFVSTGETAEWSPIGGCSGIRIRSLTVKQESGRTVLWVGTENGLCRLFPDTAVGPETVWNAPHTMVLGVLEQTGSATSDTVWVATSIGLVRLRFNLWRAVTTAEGLPNPTVWSVLEIPNPTGPPAVWFGTEGGLVGWNRGGWTSYTTAQGLPANRVFCLAENPLPGSSVKLWIGTAEGLAGWEGTSFSVWSVKQGLPHNRIRCLLASRTETGEPTLYIGTGGGLAQLTGKTIRIIPLPNNLSVETVLSLHETPNPKGLPWLWVGTAHGLARFDGHDWASFDMGSGLPNNSIQAIEHRTNSDGTVQVWVGTSGGGAAFALVKPGALQWTVLSDATLLRLPHNFVYQIRNDGIGNVYLSTNRGVVRLTPTDLPPDQWATRIYTAEDGLPSNECNSGALFLGGQDRIWVGTTMGAALLDRTAEAESRSLAPLVVERVKALRTDEKPNRLVFEIKPGAGHPMISIPAFQLDYDENSVHFEYALLCFVHEAETRFRTQLVGYEQQPSTWTPDTQRDYTNLSEGKYTFQVWARDYKGKEIGPLMVQFEVATQPWRTWWAMGMYLFLVAGGVYGVTRWRLKTLEKRNQELERRVAQRTTEIAQALEQVRASEQLARQAQEQALVERNKAVEANQSKTLFLANMSHELRTPLNAILGFVQVMERDRGRTAEDFDNLEIIARSGQNLLDLINDVLEVSRIEAGRLTLNEHAFDIRQVLKNIEELFTERAQVKKLRFKVEIADSLPEFVLADEGKFRQIFVKLLGNAFKYTGHGHVAFRARWENGIGLFTVEDTGQGIRPEDQPLIFEAFVQSQKGQAYREGVGIGLTITRKFVRLMGGDITLNSEIGRGTTFSLALKLPEVERVDVLEEPVTITGFAEEIIPPKVLVVDGKWENRCLLTKILRPVGFEVREAADGKDALEQCAAWQPDLVLLDLRAPIVDGYEVVKRLKPAGSAASQNPGQGLEKVVVFAVTTDTDDLNQETLHTNGFDDCIVKPFQHNQLFTRIGQHLGLRYRYCQTENSPTEVEPSGHLTVESLALLPPTILTSLYQALNEGNVSEANEILNQVSSEDVTIITAIRQYIRNYRFDELLDLMDGTQK
ncbi:MAG: response regulator [Blastocatellia bacterium]|nr:response regulator [Blastocatellia bacterium]